MVALVFMTLNCKFSENQTIQFLQITVHFFYYSLADLISPLSMCFHEDMELSEKSSKRGQRSAKYRSVDDPVVARP